MHRNFWNRINNYKYNLNDSPAQSNFNQVQGIFSYEAKLQKLKKKIILIFDIFSKFGNLEQCPNKMHKN